MKQQPVTRFVSRTIIYVVILASTFCALRFVFKFFNLLYTDIDNARYLLSAMAQSQAAIIAIVITVSLVAVQLGASSYSPRVVDIFKGNLDLWFLLALYGGSMSYDLIVLKILSERTSEFYIFISYWLCVSAFLGLFPYILSVISVLRPEVIIKRLVEDICTPSVGPESVIGKGLRVGDPKGDPFQPVIDIIRGAFMRYDYETARMGLKRMRVKVTEVINSYNTKKYRFIPGVQNPVDPFKDFLKCYSNHLSQIGKLFAERNEELTLEMIENLKGVAETITEKRLETEEYVVEALGDIGEISTQKEFKRATEAVMDAIGDIGEAIPYEDYTKTFQHGAKYAYPYGNIVRQVVYALDKIGVLAVKKWGLYELQDVSRNVEKAGIAMVNEGLVNKWEIITVADTFRKIGIIAINTEENFTHTEDFILCDRVIRPLDAIGKIAYEKKMLPPEKGVVSGFGRVVFAIWSVGTYAAMKGFNEAVSESAKALAELATLDEGIIKEELDSLKFRWKDHQKIRIELLAKFQEFVKTYEEHLKELRSSKDRTQNKEQPL